MVHVTSTEIGWANTTKSFGELNGAQRGDIEFSVTGPADAVLTVELEDRRAELTLAELQATPVHIVLGGRGSIWVNTD